MRMFSLLASGGKRSTTLTNRIFKSAKCSLRICDRRKGLHGRDVAGASHHNVGVFTVIARGPVPDADVPWCGE